MGWGWSLWCVQRAHEHQASLNGLRDEQRVVDRNVPPSLGPNDVAHAIYVDNFMTISHNPDVSAEACNRHINHLESIDLPCHEIESASTFLKFAGLDFDGIDNTCRVSWNRIWKIRFCIDYVLSLTHLYGRQLEAILGHVTWACMVQKHSLSIFVAVYDFARLHRDERTMIWPSVRRELQRMRKYSSSPLCHARPALGFHSHM